MKKIQYITPVVDIYQTNLASGLLLSASSGGTSLLGNGGTTIGNVTESDTKEDNAWDIWGE